jgi:DNA-binding SARP family transcriptional activator
MLRIQLLGSFQIIDDERPVTRLQSERLQALLAYLVLQRDQPLSRQQLAVTFWPDTTDAQARTNLRTLIARLREALPDAEQFLAIDAQAMQWRGDAPCAIDLIEFEQAVASGALAHAVELYRGDLLPACYDDWITSERERLRQAYQHVLDRLIAQSEKQGQFDQAIAYAQRLLRHDPLHETTYRHLMRLQLASSERSGALRTYHACAAMLRDELGVEPSAETRALYAQLLKVDEAVIVIPTEPVRTLFVGRDAEWSHLLTAWRSASAGHPQLVLITGEAGIGKTHLAEYLQAHLDRQGVTTLTARCYATERNTAYAPIGQWLRSEALRDRLPTLDQVWLIEVARLATWLLADRPDLPAPGPLTEAWQRQRLFEAVARVILIRREPLLLLLDDVQWCDRETLDWLHYLLQFDPTAPLLIVATLRQEEADDNEAFSTWRLLLQKHDGLTEVPLTRFDEVTTTVLASSLSEHDLQAAEAARIYRETEGNPLFVVEMMRAGGRATDQAVMTIEQVLPPKVQATIQYRLSQLSANAQALIQIAAVIGREFTFEVLARASEANEDALVQGLDELWRKQVVREQGVSAYDFSHNKIRVVTYATLSTIRRRVLHRKVAEALVNTYSTNLDAVSAQIAQHYEIAGQIDRAIEFYRWAAQAAQRIYAHHDALTTLEKAIGLLGALADDKARHELAVQLQENLGDVQEILTQHAAARVAYTTALSVAPTGDKIVQARLQRKVGKTLENEQADFAQVSTRYEEAETLLGMPDDRAEAAWWEEWCQIQLERLVQLYLWNRSADMAVLVEQVRPAIERHGTPPQRAALFQNMSRQTNRQNRFALSDIALEFARAAVAAVPLSASPETHSDHQFSLGFNLLWHGDLSEARATLQAALETAEQTRDVSLQVRCLAYLAITCRRQNHPLDTERYASRGLILAEGSKMPDYIGSNQANLAWTEWRQGNLTDAERLAQAALNTWHAPTRWYPFFWLGLLPLLSLALCQNSIDQAVEFAQQIVDPRQQKLPDPIEPLIQQAISAWQAADAITTRRLLNDAIDHAQSFGYL